MFSPLMGCSSSAIPQNATVLTATDMPTKSNITGLKRKFPHSCSNVLFYEPARHKSPMSSSASHKVISIKSSSKTPRSGVELNELVVQGQKVGSTLNCGELKTANFSHKAQVKIPTKALTNIIRNNKVDMCAVLGLG